MFFFYTKKRNKGKRDMRSTPSLLLPREKSIVCRQERGRVDLAFVKNRIPLEIHIVSIQGDLGHLHGPTHIFLMKK